MSGDVSNLPHDKQSQSGDRSNWQQTRLLGHRNPNNGLLHPERALRLLLPSAPRIRLLEHDLTPGRRVRYRFRHAGLSHVGMEALPRRPVRRNGPLQRAASSPRRVDLWRSWDGREDGNEVVDHGGAAVYCWRRNLRC